MVYLFIVAGIAFIAALFGYYRHLNRVVEVSIVEVTRGVMISTGHHGIRLPGGSYVLIGKKYILRWLEDGLNDDVSAMNIPDGIVVRVQKSDIIGLLRSGKGNFVATAEISHDAPGGLMGIFQFSEDGGRGQITLVKLPPAVLDKIISEKRRIESIRKSYRNLHIKRLKQ